VGEGSGEFKPGVAGDIRDKPLEFGRLGPKPVHAGVELRLDQGGGAGFLCSPREFLRLLQGGKGYGEAMSEGDGKFRGKGGAKQKNRFPDAGLAQFRPLRGEGDAEFLATGPGKGTGHRDQAVSVGVVLDDGENADAAGSGGAENAQVGAQGRKGNRAPGAERGGHKTILEKTADARKLFVFVFFDVDGGGNKKNQAGFRAGRRWMGSRGRPGSRPWACR